MTAQNAFVTRKFSQHTGNTRPLLMAVTHILHHTRSGEPHTVRELRIQSFFPVPWVKPNFWWTVDWIDSAHISTDTHTKCEGKPSVTSVRGLGEIEKK